MNSFMNRRRTVSLACFRLGLLMAVPATAALAHQEWAVAAENAAAKAARAASAPPKGTPGNSRPSDAVSAADLTVLQKLHDSNQMEIQMGHLAETKGASKTLRDYGHRLVADHTAADKRVGEFLKQRGLDLKSLATTTSADPAHSTAADQAGANFDRTFAAQMVKDHQKSFDLLENARRATADEQLKTLYGEFMANLEAHRKLAQSLAEGKGRL